MQMAFLVVSDINVTTKQNRPKNIKSDHLHILITAAASITHGCQGDNLVGYVAVTHTCHVAVMSSDGVKSQENGKVIYDRFFRHLPKSHSRLSLLRPTNLVTSFRNGHFSCIMKKKNYNLENKIYFL